jgi:hypothetical protein
MNSVIDAKQLPESSTPSYVEPGATFFESLTHEARPANVPTLDPALTGTSYVTSDCLMDKD